MRRKDSRIYIDTSLVNQRKNSRGSEGRSMARRCTTLVSDQSCPFQFSVQWDSIGYFVPLTRKKGCPFHNYHPAIDPENVSIPTRFLGQNEKETLFYLVQACCGNGISRSYVYSKIGRFLSCSKIAYLFDRNND